jgi:dienelactone hydrolase
MVSIHVYIAAVPLVSLLLGLMSAPAAALAASAGDTAAEASATAHYLIEKVHIPNVKTSCIPAFLYTPNKPLTDPPGLVVMIPALGQNALQPGLHSYAHAFAANGLAVLILSAPGSLSTTSKDPKVRSFLLNCGKQQQQQQVDIPDSLFRGQFRASVRSYVQLLARQGRINAGRVAYWGAEWGAVAAVQAAVEQQQGALPAQALILQVSVL